MNSVDLSLVILEFPIVLLEYPERAFLELFLGLQGRGSIFTGQNSVTQSISYITNLFALARTNPASQERAPRSSLSRRNLIHAMSLASEIGSCSEKTYCFAFYAGALWYTMFNLFLKSLFMYL